MGSFFKLKWAPELIAQKKINELHPINNTISIHSAWNGLKDLTNFQENLSNPKYFV